MLLFSLRRRPLHFYCLPHASLPPVTCYCVLYHRPRLLATMASPMADTTTSSAGGVANGTSNPDHFGAIVLGSGQGGTPLTLSLARAGHRTLLVEATHIGGSKLVARFLLPLPLFSCL